MTDTYFWNCICGAEGRGEKAAMAHGKTCNDFGRPWTNPHVARPL